MKANSIALDCTKRLGSQVHKNLPESVSWLGLATHGPRDAIFLKAEMLIFRLLANHSKTALKDLFCPFLITNLKLFFEIIWVCLDKTQLISVQAHLDIS